MKNAVWNPVQRVVVNLCPCRHKKTGAIYDLPILVGILCSTGALPALPEGLALVGELSLDGHLRPVNGILSMVADARRRGLPGIIIPRANAAEGAVFPDFPVYAADSVEEVLRHLRGENLRLASSLPVSAEPEAPSRLCGCQGAAGGPGGRQRWQLPADTTCSCWGRRAQARA